MEVVEDVDDVGTGVLDDLPEDRLGVSAVRIALVETVGHRPGVDRGSGGPTRPDLLDDALLFVGDHERDGTPGIQVVEEAHGAVLTSPNPSPSVPRLAATRTSLAARRRLVNSMLPPDRAAASASFRRRDHSSPNAPTFAAP